MTVHENLIRDECGYTGRMPYWDELADIDSVIADLDMFKDEYFGSNGAGEDSCIGSGSFVNMTLAFANNAANADGRHCVWRNFSEAKLQQAAQVNIDECMAISNYTSAWSVSGRYSPLASNGNDHFSDLRWVVLGKQASRCGPRRHRWTGKSSPTRYSHSQFLTLPTTDGRPDLLARRPGLLPAPLVPGQAVVGVAKGRLPGAPDGHGRAQHPAWHAADVAGLPAGQRDRLLQ